MALVVTIIVLIILAGVTINLTISNNGIFTRAQNATAKYEEASLNEQSELDEVADIIDELNENLNGEEDKTIAMFDTGVNVATKMRYFYNDWNISKVTNFGGMFENVPTHPDFTKVEGTWDSNGTFTPNN